MLTGKKLLEAKTALFLRMAVTHPDNILVTLNDPELKINQEVKDEISGLIRSYNSVLNDTFDQMISVLKFHHLKTVASKSNLNRNTKI